MSESEKEPHLKSSHATFKFDDRLFRRVGASPTHASVPSGVPATPTRQLPLSLPDSDPPPPPTPSFYPDSNIPCTPNSSFYEKSPQTQRADLSIREMKLSLIDPADLIKKMPELPNSGSSGIAERAHEEEEEDEEEKEEEEQEVVAESDDVDSGDECEKRKAGEERARSRSGESADSMNATLNLSCNNDLNETLNYASLDDDDDSSCDEMWNKEDGASPTGTDGRCDEVDLSGGQKAIDDDATAREKGDKEVEEEQEGPQSGESRTSNESGAKNNSMEEEEIVENDEHRMSLTLKKEYEASIMTRVCEEREEENEGTDLGRGGAAPLDEKPTILNEKDDDTSTVFHAPEGLPPVAEETTEMAGTKVTVTKMEGTKATVTKVEGQKFEEQDDVATVLHAPENFEVPKTAVVAKSPPVKKEECPTVLHVPETTDMIRYGSEVKVAKDELNQVHDDTAETGEEEEAEEDDGGKADDADDEDEDNDDDDDDDDESSSDDDDVIFVEPTEEEKKYAHYNSFDSRVSQWMDHRSSKDLSKDEWPWNREMESGAEPVKSVKLVDDSWKLVGEDLLKLIDEMDEIVAREIRRGRSRISPQVRTSLPCNQL